MSRNVTKTSVSIDSDLLEPAQERSRQFNRFREVNLSAYVSWLIRKDLGMSNKDPDFEQAKSGTVLEKDRSLDDAAAAARQKVAEDDTTPEKQK